MTRTKGLGSVGCATSLFTTLLAPRRLMWRRFGVSRNKFRDLKICFESLET
jgi:hypothetical protein